MFMILIGRTNLRSTSDHKLFIPRAHQRSICFSGPKFWNNLTSETRAAKSLRKFKLLYHMHSLRELTQDATYAQWRLLTTFWTSIIIIFCLFVCLLYYNLRASWQTSSSMSHPNKEFVLLYCICNTFSPNFTVSRVVQGGGGVNPLPPWIRLCSE